MNVYVRSDIWLSATNVLVAI